MSSIKKKEEIFEKLKELFDYQKTPKWSISTTDILGGQKLLGLI